MDNTFFLIAIVLFAVVLSAAWYGWSRTRSF